MQEQLRAETKLAEAEVTALEGKCVSLRTDGYRDSERLTQYQLLADWKQGENDQWTAISDEREDTERDLLTLCKEVQEVPIECRGAKIHDIYMLLGIHGNVGQAPVIACTWGYAVEPFTRSIYGQV